LLVLKMMSDHGTTPLSDAIDKKKYILALKILILKNKRSRRCISLCREEVVGRIMLGTFHVWVQSFQINK
jgi:hypothetical protein